MVEGGASIISSFLRSKSVNHLIITIAPVFVGSDGIAAYKAGEGLSKLGIKNILTEQLGLDIIVAYSIERSS